MNDIKELANIRANKIAPKGFTLWSSYLGKKAAKFAKKLYGCKSDIIKDVGEGWFALYGRSYP